MTGSDSEEDKWTLLVHSPASRAKIASGEKYSGKRRLEIRIKMGRLVDVGGINKVDVTLRNCTTHELLVAYRCAT